MIITDNYDPYGYSPEKLNISYLYMFWETIIITFAINIYKRKNNRINAIKPLKRSNNIVNICAIILGAGCLLLYPELIKNLIWTRSNDLLIEDDFTNIYDN